MRGADVTDGELIERTGGGDRDAFEQLYRRYVRAVFGLALRRLDDRTRAEDAVRETFASVWRSAPSYRAEREPGAPWLYAVARSAIAGRARAGVELPAEVPDEADAWRVHRALEELPERERDVIALGYWSGLSQSEVAEFLGSPPETVETRTRAALARLAGLLEGEEL